MPKDAYLFVVSDHGFTLRQGMFYLNTWLWKNGYLQVEREKHESHRISTPHGAAKYRALQKRRFTPLPAMIYWMHISPRFWRALRSLLRPLQRALKLQSDYRYGSAVPQKSKAYCPWEGMWGIFLNDRRRFADGTIQTKEEYQHLLEEIQANLSELKDPESHVQVFDAVEKREDLYQGKWVHQAPDLILTSHRFQIDTIVTHPRILFRPARHQGHSPLGIFVASGPEIQNDLRFQGASIVDVAPTILHLMNTSIPSDRDGRVLWEIFQEDSEVRRRKPTFVTPRPSLETPPVCTAEEKQGVKDRLKSLGYL